MNNNKKVLFVYGSLKKGFYNNDILGNFKLLSREATSVEYYKMYPCMEYLFPYLFISDAYSGGKRIVGNLYEVDDAFLNETLDMFEGVPSGRYERHSVEVILKDEIIVEAQMYISNNGLLESDEVDIIPEPLNIWSKEYEQIGLRTNAYIESNLERQ